MSKLYLGHFSSSFNSFTSPVVRFQMSSPFYYSFNAYKALRTRTYSSLATSDKRSHYDIMGLNQSSTSAEIKKKYFELAKKYHPDRNRNKSPEEKRSALKQYTRIKEAYEVLGNKEKRELFDIELRNVNGSNRGATTKDARANNYYGQSRYSGSHYSASSLHRRSRAQTYHYYNKHHEYASAKTTQKNNNPLKSEYKSGSNYDVPHFDFDRHFQQQKSYEIHRQKQHIKRNIEHEAEEAGKTDTKSNERIDHEFIFNEYDLDHNYSPYRRQPKAGISITPTGIFVSMSVCCSFILLYKLL